ncbi:hypothetical protein DICPUDRAFT_153872 [Dictyostelium purpureum]|uniref:VTT domain-containing protein n=1 Tax=Dictyostelium purpureum TaxID=5786 RepID=F0ZPY5_DICPU|nr:uncharacterized protein DICPUDRAFT_153872 [Dictyostelium purpureum]EGC33999.1 hypothetical protein DICPUDRAFT_153872 [Dictyostelium purpureum]|eukprot:XP_003289485.1 hypothetical protein DICPUDRAFT_153872 [Dictyostelium purpureum]
MIQNSVVVLNNTYKDSSNSDTDQQFLLEDEKSSPLNNNPVITLWRPFKKPLGPQPQTNYFKMTANITTPDNININNNNNNNLNNDEKEKEKENKDIEKDEKEIENEEKEIDNDNNNTEKLPIHKRFLNLVKGFTFSTWVKIIIFVLMATTILVVVFKFKIQDHLFTYMEKLQTFIKDHNHGNVIGGFIFMGGFALLIIFLIPVTIPTIVGGVIFGFWYGLLFVWSASMVGGSISFLLGRFVFRKRIRGWISTRPKMKAVDEAVGKESWKLVLLLRLTPIVPESILNYALAVNKKLDQQIQDQDKKDNSNAADKNDETVIDIEKEKLKQKPLDINNKAQVEINVYNNNNDGQSSVNSSYNNNNNNFEEYDNDNSDERASLLGNINNSDDISSSSNSGQSSFRRIMLWWLTPKKQQQTVLVN